MSTKIISNLNKLKAYIVKSSELNKDKIKNIINLYQERKIINFKTAINIIKLLLSTNRTIINSNKAINTYNYIINKYQNSIPIYQIYNSQNPLITVSRIGRTKFKSDIQLKITYGSNLECVFKSCKSILIKELNKLLLYQDDVKFTLYARVLASYKKDNTDLILYKKNYPVSKHIVDVVTPLNLNYCIDNQIKYLAEECINNLNYCIIKIYKIIVYIFNNSFNKSLPYNLKSNLIKKLPIELQNKILFYYLKHPTANIIKNNLIKINNEIIFIKKLFCVNLLNNRLSTNNNKFYRNYSIIDN